jgi:hypothetical protein
MVRSPATVYRSGPAGWTLVLWNVMTGYVPVSRKFGEHRSLSRSWLWVRMLAAWMVASTDEVSGCSGSMSAVVATSAK